MRTKFNRPLTAVAMAILALLAVFGRAGAQDVKSFTAVDGVSSVEAEVLFTVDLEPAVASEAPIKMSVDVMSDGTKVFRGERVGQSDTPVQIDFSADLETGEFVATVVEPEVSMVSATAAAKPELDRRGRDLGGMGPIDNIGGVTGYTHSAQVKATRFFGSVAARATSTLLWCWDSGTQCQIPILHGGTCAAQSGEWETLSCTGIYGRPSAVVHSYKVIGLARELSGGVGTPDTILQSVTVTAVGANSFATFTFSTTALTISGSLVDFGKHLTVCL